jgi:wyosine [tRNA(Phe)-imidazoG37] synthetase (radical SAM superfamily)
LYTFGPVNSRRFGLSLGIDLSPTIKSCNYDCLYCELDRGKRVDSIDSPPLVEDVIKDVKQALKRHPKIDVITITANGEPTLFKDLKKLVEELNLIKEDKKLLILSNGSNIVDALYDIDIVKLSLDCASSRCFKKIDRPLSGISIEKIISDMVEFAQKFKNTLVIEVLLVEGINDKEEEIIKLNQALHKISPHRVDLGSIDRPPAYSVKGVTEDRLLELSKLFTDIPLSIVHKNPSKTKESFSKDEIIELLSRRPQSEFDIDSFFDQDSKDALFRLVESSIVKRINLAGVIFFKIETSE